jgi:4-amino-4-deoxy-L-arabinose transferase-like glycosyltransferase
VLAALFFALRLLAAGRSGLFFDEAYYWQWSTNLKPGYFDHPPIIALFIRVGTLLFGNTNLGIRFMPALSAPLTALTLWAVALRLTGDRRLAAWTAIFATVSGAALLSLAALPDEPMVLFWLCAVLALVAVYRGGSPAWWIVAGATTGLAGDSKYTAGMLALGLFLWTLWEPSLRRWYRTPWPWLGLAAILAAMSPVIAWNTPRGWPSLLLQSMRDGLHGSALDSVLEYLGLMLLLASPPVLVLAIIGFLRGPHRPLLLFAVLPIAAFLAVFAFTDEVTANSVLPIAYWSALPAGLAMSRARRWSGGLAAISLLLGLVLIPATYVLFSLPAGTVDGPLDLARNYRGWPEAALAVDRVREENGAAYIVADRYFYPGHLKLALGVDAPVFHLSSPEYEPEYSRWRRWEGFPSAAPGMAGAKAIFIGGEAAARLYYDTVLPLPPVERPTGSARPPRLSLYLVSGPKPVTGPLFNNWR